MSEPTMTKKLSDFQAQTGLFLGWGRGLLFGDPAWSSYQQAVIAEIVKSGYEQFLKPPPLEGESSPYTEWSFLKPYANLTLASGSNVLILPDDFGGLEGQLNLGSAQGVAWMPLSFIGIGDVYRINAQNPTTTGRPTCVALEPLKGTSTNAGQIWQLRFYPIADQAYPVQFQYYVNPDAPTPDLPYAYGSRDHSETILESCLAIAEERLDDMIGGPHGMKFKERLAASIAIERKKKPQMLGLNRDMSDFRDRLLPNGYRRGWPAITLNGQIYS